jgi:hypothetical protein
MTYEAACARAAAETCEGRPTLVTRDRHAKGGYSTYRVPAAVAWPRRRNVWPRGRAARAMWPQKLKLNEAVVIEATSRFLAGTDTQKDLAKYFEVHPTTMRQAIRRESWKDVEGPAASPIVKTCSFCGQPFETQDLRKRFCQERCQSRAAKKRVLAKLRAATRLRLGDKRCDFCGRGFDARDSRARWCTATCRARAYAERRGVLIEPRAMVRKDIEVPA